MSETSNILLCGVGGQGILLASEILSEIALRKGLDVKKSEVHGMAQRGGSVVSHVRIGKTVHSPLIPAGKVDYMLAFERMEALRWRELLSPETIAIINMTTLIPTNVNVGLAEYPQDLDSYFAQEFKTPRTFDASALALEAGTIKATNIVMLGALMREMGEDMDDCLAVVKDMVPPKSLGINLHAFEAGYRQRAEA